MLFSTLLQSPDTAILERVFFNVGLLSCKDNTDGSRIDKRPQTIGQGFQNQWEVKLQFVVVTNGQGDKPVLRKTDSLS